MTLKLQHAAAAVYLVVCGFLVSSWLLLLFPLEGGLGQLEFVFGDSYQNRPFFVWYATATVATLFPAVLFWSARSSLSPLNTVLAIWAAALFAVAVWQFDATLIFGFGLGLTVSLWSWYAPDTELGSRRIHKQRARLKR
jgi:hypothetical protein